MNTMLHPEIGRRRNGGSSGFSGGTLVCRCADRPVKVEVTSAISHNHACGCTKCWKPEGAAFSIVAVAPTDQVRVIENGDKLAVVDASALIQRQACKACGAHLHGPVERDHAFQGLSFIHPELFERDDWPAPEFAAFVSSAIEGGVEPEAMPEVRAELKRNGLEPYDCLSPPLMDALAAWTARKNGVLV